MEKADCLLNSVCYVFYYIVYSVRPLKKFRLKQKKHALINPITSGDFLMNMTKPHYLDKKKRHDVLEKVTTIISAKPEIAFAFLYGSFLEESVFRDIDIGISITGIDVSGFWDYECMLAQQIEDELNQSITVEVKVINSAPVSFCFQVVRGKLLFARDEEPLLKFMVSTARRYLDMSPLRRTYMIEAMT